MTGRPRVHHREVGSTNVLARELAAGGAPNGTLVTADHQSAGRGRSDRVWEAPRRTSVLMSLVVRPSDPLLPLRAAVALCDVVPEAAIKWPNDVLVGGRKVAGILVEGRPQEGWAVLGMGVNVTAVPAGFEDTATCLAAQGDPRGVAGILDALLGGLGSRLRQEPAELLAAWRERDVLLGRRITWDGGTGTAEGVDDSGALLVDTAEGRVALDAGEVHLDPLGG